MDESPAEFGRARLYFIVGLRFKAGEHIAPQKRGSESRYQRVGDRERPRARG